MRIVASLLLLASPVFSDETAIHHVVPFAGPSSASQKLDLYVPSVLGEWTAEEGHPLGVFVWIHCGDGGKVDLAKRENKSGALELLFIRVEINIPMHSEATMKQDLVYVAAAIRWICEHAKDYQAGKDLIYVGGDSSGAQIAALICLDDLYLKAEGLTLSAIKGCVLVDGDAYDLPLRLAEQPAQGAEKLLSAYGGIQNVKNYTPVTHVSGKKDVPPCLILELTRDPIIESQGMRLYGAMKAAAFQVKIVSAFNDSHGTFTGENGINLNMRISPFRDYSYALFACFENRAKPRVLETFRAKLKDIHNPDSAEAVFGTPDVLASDSLEHFIYSLNDGSEVRLTFAGRGPGNKSPLCGNLFRAKVTTSDGKDELLPFKKK